MSFFNPKSKDTSQNQANFFIIILQLGTFSLKLITVRMFYVFEIIPIIIFKKIWIFEEYKAKQNSITSETFKKCNICIIYLLY